MMRAPAPFWDFASRIPAVFLLFLLSAQALYADIARFVGTYDGSAEVELADGTMQARDMFVKIDETKEGYVVEWTSTTIRADGSRKEKSYSIEFAPSGRNDVFAAAMKQNVFGHSVQLDPMKGEPYVWSRISDDTLTVYSLYVAEDGGYEIQQFDRTLASGGLELAYKSVLNGKINRTVTTFLEKR
ncbi:MAG: hypothetical protein AAF636_08970 [Pseudomonadota bacterium]